MKPLINLGLATAWRKTTNGDAWHDTSHNTTSFKLCTFFEDIFL